MKSIRGIELRQSGEEVEVETYDLTGKVHTLITDFFHVVTKDEEESCDEMGTDTPPPHA